MRNKIKFTVGFGIATAVLAAGLNFAAATESTTTTNSGTGSTDLSATIKAECMVDGLVNADCVMKVRARFANTQTKPVLKRLEEKKKTERQAKIREISKVYQNQIDRAQKSIDKLQNIIDRIKAQRTKMSASASAEDLAALDVLITKAQTQKDESVTALAALKVKADAIKATLNAVTTDTSNGTDTDTANITKMKQQVKEFQASVKELKKKLIALHTTLNQIVKKMKAINKVTEDKVKKEESQENETHVNSTTNTSGTAGGEEND
jgi:uncharacterized protein YlxW (UPF0749 family)